MARPARGMPYVPSFSTGRRCDRDKRRLTGTRMREEERERKRRRPGNQKGVLCVQGGKRRKRNTGRRPDEGIREDEGEEEEEEEVKKAEEKTEGHVNEREVRFIRDSARRDSAEGLLGGYTEHPVFFHEDAGVSLPGDTLENFEELEELFRDSIEVTVSVRRCKYHADLDCLNSGLGL